MSDRKAIIFDTNFIIGYKSNFREVCQELSKTYDVFISTVSIEERLSQKYLELRKKYEELEKIIEEYSAIARIEKKHFFEVQFETESEFTQKAYSELFGNNIIPFEPNVDMLKTVMDRVYKKTPPFLNTDGASDKGLKDTLLWLSLLGYFKDYNGDSVIFFTDDKGFRNNLDALRTEFNKYTGKTIEIMENNSYKTLIEKPVELKTAVSVPLSNDESSPIISESSLEEINTLRKRIQDDVSAMCGGYYYTDNYGNSEWRDTFVLQDKVTPEDMKKTFDNLRKVLNSNIFESELSADVAFTKDKNISNLCDIPIEVLRNALSVYEDICSKYQDLLPQFYNATVNIFNKNYQPDYIPF